MLFNQVTKEHILLGIKDYQNKGLPNGFGPSSTYDLVYQGKRYPPKAVMVYANYHAIGRKIERYFKGGIGTDCFLAFEQNGFDVIPKNQEIESEIVKKEFAKWLLKNATINYQPYYGKTVDSVIEKLNEINDFFDKDLFSVNKDNFKEMISYISFINSKKERIKRKEFYDYDKKHSRGIPIAVLGKENYSKFLNTYFSENTNMSLEKALQPYLVKYKTLVKSSEDYDEIYKWEAIQNFQNHWNLDADDIVSMLDASFPGSQNLWAGSHFLPINMLKEFTRINKTKVVEALKNLFNENVELEARIPEYISIMDSLLIDYNKSSGRDDKSHYQDARAISLLLGFKYPAIHSLFKHGVLKTFCQQFDLTAPKTGQVAIQILTNNSINQQVKSILIKHQELIELHKNRLTPESYREDDNNILTQDFIYSIFAYDTKEPKYWLYSPGKNAYEWDHFYSKGMMALGWGELGDLTNYQSKEDVVKALQDLYDTDSSKKNDATATFNFMSEMNIGDVVFVKKGNSKLLGYGIIASDYEFDFNAQEFKHVRKVNWKKKGIWNAGHNLAIKTLTDISNYPSPDSNHSTYHERLMAIINDNQISTSKTQTMSYPINSILYGPPGTGKTFNTVNRALEICGESIDGLDRKEIKELYDLKVAEGQIIFTTFHQSMSYEDFIEGIKPIEPEKEGDPVIYKVIEGIFKKACIEASFNFALDNNDTDTDKVLDFSLAYDNFIQKLEERLASETEVELEIKNGGKVYVDSISQQGNIQIKHLEGLRTYTVSKTRLSKLQKAITNLDEISNINDSFRAIIGGSNSTAYWSVLNAIQKENHFDNILNNTERKYSPEEKREAVKELDKNIYKGNTGKPIVLIIDEINRGNVSAIFGELITLIEKDKRLGADEALMAQLPYSKETFGVPPNLYIIGTMNTADRSVEALDSALRRRFSFTEMPPKPKFIKEVGSANNGIVEDINLVKVLKTINNRIEKLLDRDHAIGHSYFLKVKNLKQLKAVFANKVIPLLQEYFFGDYGKIGLVLGSGFVKSIQDDNEDGFFASFEDYDLGTLLERKMYRIKDATEMNNEDFKKALLKLIG
ncbi:AAA family ATPase [Maribacter sp. Hel_I_7]|uniref:AAA family ATPase n=1 Tax=Maribacter sp. Hel_I_7 TaxID=1249997 RepID=UPI00047B0746|nr:AAA family ATPase [Maribacter sp. Hel_I_7]